jgi:glutaredoxin-related protein
MDFPCEITGDNIRGEDMIEKLRNMEIKFEMISVVGDEVFEQSVIQYCGWNDFPLLFMGTKLLGNKLIVEKLLETQTKIFYL